MRTRIAWSLVSMLVITFVVAGMARAQKVAQAQDLGSQLSFNNELQVAPNAAGKTPVVGTTTGTAAELAETAVEKTTASEKTAAVAAETAITAEAAPSTDFSADKLGVDEETAGLGIAQKAETDIPVTLDTKVIQKTSETSLRDMILVFAVLGGFGLLGYMAISRLKYKNKKASQFEMKILAQHHLGPKKSLAVVRVAGESILIGMTDHHISMIKSLALLDEELPETDTAQFKTGFNSIFANQNSASMTSEDQSQEMQARENQSRRSQSRDVSADSEEFTISKIRDVVTRQIRQMKTLE